MRFLKVLTPWTVLAVFVLAPASSAFAALPAYVIADINAAAAGANAVTAQERAVGQAIGERSLQWIQARRAEVSGAQALSVVVASAIAQNPHLTGEIIAAAVTAAPASRTAIAQIAARNYPGFAALIYRAAGASPPITRPAAALRQRPQATRAYPAMPSAPGLTSGYRSTPAAYNPSYRISLQQGQSSPLPSYQPSYRPGQIQAPATTRPRLTGRQTPLPAEASPGTEEIEQDAIDDPIEGFNRAVFAVNDAFDIMIFRPLAALYGYLMPNPAKPAAQRFFKNLTLPVVMINDLVQLDGKDAAVSAGRFVVNSTVGVLGLFDVAAGFGLKEHHADFGQSLHSYGVGSGPYIVLPLLGPSTLRDGTGQLVDFAVDPFNYLLDADWKTARTVGSALVQREALVFPLDELRSSSVDYYSALRSAYYQKRLAELRKGRAGGKAREKAVDDMFDDAE